jgi:hypothetical protein
MNGRIYDPIIARFMTPDPYLQAPSDLQSYSRYSYVRNNPLMYTDPSGYSWLSKAIHRAADNIGRASTNLLGHLGEIPVIGGLAQTAFLTGYSGQIYGLSTGDWRSVGQAYVTSGILAASYYMSAVWAEGPGAAMFGQYPAHALAGCASGILGGNGCGPSAAAEIAGMGIGQVFGHNLVAAMLAGGTASVIGGGKFANGALTASFAYLGSSYLSSARSAGEDNVPVGNAAAGGGEGEDGWGRPETLQDHFERHGPDFGARDANEYARMSREFRVDALNNPRTELRFDSDGTVRIYDRATNTFGSYNEDGSTKTFFKPKTGERYWANQPGKAPSEMSPSERAAAVNRMIRRFGAFGRGGEE